MTSEFTICDDILNDDPTWKEWKALIEKEQWLSDDHSVTAITPIQPTTHSVVAKTKEGRYAGSVVWNEYDGVSFIGFYILMPQFRNKGLGSLIWRRAISRMPKENTIALRGVPTMAPKYQQWTTPHRGPTLYSYIGDAARVEETMRCALLEISRSSVMDIRHVRDLDTSSFEKFLAFDRFVTGRDREDMLRKYHSLPFTDGILLFDDQQNVIACAATVSTTQMEDHLHKIAPVYASEIGHALLLILQLATIINKEDPGCRIYMPIISTTAGESQLVPILRQCMEEITSGVSLFSHEYNNPIRLSHVFVPNNNSLHMDL